MHMNNTEVETRLDECSADLNQVSIIVTGLGATSSVVPYLTKYAIIRACGTIEQTTKTIVADYCSKRSKKQVKQFITKKVRESSTNPSYSNICKLLEDFDTDWRCNYKIYVEEHPEKSRLLDSLQSLIDARNDFAHGGNPSATIADVLQYFSDSRCLIETLDRVIT
jgi:hypothetical protein